MTPQDLAGPDIHGQEFAEIAVRLRMLVFSPPHRTGAAASERLFWTGPNVAFSQFKLIGM